MNIRAPKLRLAYLDEGFYVNPNHVTVVRQRKNDEGPDAVALWTVDSDIPLELLDGDMSEILERLVYGPYWTKEEM